MKLSRVASALFLAASMIACSSSVPGDHPIDRPDRAPTEEIEVAGNYVAESVFEVSASNLGNAEQFIVDMEKMADDPIEALAEALADEIGLPLDSLIEGALREVMGDREAEISSALSSFASAAADFDVISDLRIRQDGSSLSMTHQPRSMVVVVDRDRYEYEFEGLKQDALESFTIRKTGATTTNAHLTFEEHDLEIPYAQLLLTLVDEMLVPALDSEANDLGDAFANMADCEGVGIKLGEQELFGLDAQAWEIACAFAVEGVANELESKIGDIDSLSFAINIGGRGTAIDQNDDGRADRIEGSWDTQFIGIETRHDTPFIAIRDGGVAR